MTPEELWQRYLTNDGDQLTPAEREAGHRWRRDQFTKAQANRKGGRR